MPPQRQIMSASMRNCRRIVRRRAPSALRSPISLVRSATETNMMFIIPMPPTKSESPVMKSPALAITPVTLLKVVRRTSCLLMAKSSAWPGSRRRTLRMAPRISSVISSTLRISGALMAMLTLGRQAKSLSCRVTGI